MGKSLFAFIACVVLLGAGCYQKVDNTAVREANTCEKLLTVDDVKSIFTGEWQRDEKEGEDGDVYCEIWFIGQINNEQHRLLLVYSDSANAKNASKSFKYKKERVVISDILNNLGDEAFFEERDNTYTDTFKLYIRKGRYNIEIFLNNPNLLDKKGVESIYKEKIAEVGGRILKRIF